MSFLSSDKLQRSEMRSDLVFAPPGLKLAKLLGEVL